MVERRQILFAVKRALNDADVRWMVVKGPVIAARFYPAEWTRQYNDIDIVVHPDDVGGAIDALCDAGAKMLDRNWGMIARKRQGEVSLVYGSTLLDLHWHFYSSPSIRRRCGVNMRAVLNRRRETNLSGLTVPIMDDLDGLIFLATHAVLSGGHRAKWMLDFAFAFRTLNPPLAELFVRAREHDAALQLAVMIQRVEDSLGVAIGNPQRFLSRPENLWMCLCATTGRYAPVESSLSGRVTGRAVFSATRDSLTTSVLAMVENLIDAGEGRLRGRSEADVDRTVLHSPGGTEEDREEWLRVASAEGGGVTRWSR